MPNLEWEDVEGDYDEMKITYYKNYKITIYRNDNLWGFYLDDDESDGEDGYLEEELVIEEAINEINERVS